jgi:hypothetical protein
MATSFIITTPFDRASDILSVVGSTFLSIEQINHNDFTAQIDLMMLIFALTFLSGVNSVSVDVIQHHLKGFRDSIMQLYFEKRQVPEWHLSCPKLHRTDDTLNVTWLYILFRLYIAYLMTLQMTEYTASSGRTLLKDESKKMWKQSWPMSR